MNTFEKCFEVMSFTFDSESAVRIDAQTRNRWIYCDNFIEALEKNEEWFNYVCKKSFTAASEASKARKYAVNETAKKLVATLRGATYALRSFNAKISQCKRICKYISNEKKKYVFVEGIERMMIFSRSISLKILSVVNAFEVNHFEKPYVLCDEIESYSDDEINAWSLKCKVVRHCLKEINSQFNKALDNIGAVDDVKSEMAEVA